MNTLLDEFDIQENGKKMGMVPQSNTIWDILNVDESLDFICQIKGLTFEEGIFQKEFIKKTLDL